MRKFDVGYYPEFKLPENLPIPKELEDKLRLSWNYFYDDFENFQDSKKIDVMLECEDLLRYFGSSGLPRSIEHKRYVYMALAFAHAAIPVIKNCKPRDTRAERCLKLVDSWFTSSAIKTKDWTGVLFPERVSRVGGSFLDEAFDNFYSLLKLINSNCPPNEMLDILYDAFTGEWCGGSLAGNRDIFNWWLIEVIPAAYNLQLPRSFRPVVWKFPFRCETPEMFAERMQELENEWSNTEDERD